MQLNNKKILCTRPLDNSLIYKGLQKGVTIKTVAFIDTLPVTTTNVIEQVQKLASEKITAVFTSMNAVESVSLHIAGKPNWEIYCIGGATKTLVQATFGNHSIQATAKSGSALAEKIIQANNVTNVVFFCGDHRLDELPETLKAQSINVIELVVYTTIQTPKLIEQNFNGIVFFSPSAVHSFFSMNTVATDVIMFAIGKTTAATINTYCTNKIITSDYPGKEQMIDLVIEYFSK
jgi:uroporphyrinogen-III synthase